MERTSIRIQCSQQCVRANQTKIFQLIQNASQIRTFFEQKWDQTELSEIQLSQKKHMLNLGSEAYMTWKMKSKNHTRYQHTAFA